MEQQIDHEIEKDVDEVSDGGVYLADEKDFKNMRLAIGTLDKTIFQISLGDDLTDTRHIDICLKRNKARKGKKQEVAMAGDDQDEESSPPEPHPPPQGPRLKITIAAEDNKDQADSLSEMRGWLLTVATLFVSMAFDAMLHPPEWMKAEWYDEGLRLRGPAGWFRTHHDDHAAAMINPANSHDHASAAKVAAPSPQPPATGASAWDVNWAYLYLSVNSFTFAMALVVVLMLLSRRQASSGWGLTTMENMVKAVSLFIALTFALGTSKNWKVIGIACMALLAYAFMAVYYVLLLKHRTTLLKNITASITKEAKASKPSPFQPGLAAGQALGPTRQPSSP